MPNLFEDEFTGRLDLSSEETAMYLYDVDPGESFPYHYEYVRWLVVVDGVVVCASRTVRSEVVRGALMRFAPGPGGAHQIINRGASRARLLLFSKAAAPGVSVYPDTDAIGVWPDDDTSGCSTSGEAAPCHAKTPSSLAVSMETQSEVRACARSSCTSCCPSTGSPRTRRRFIADWDDAMDANLAAVIATQDAVILGRRSYDEWARFWPGSEIEPFATFINGVPKYVATSTPLDREWANATAIDGGLVEFVRDLKDRPGGDIGVHASISVAQALLAAGVVDELRLVIAPRIAGSGRRLLDGLPPIQLESIRSETSPTGYLLVDYRVTR